MPKDKANRDEYPKLNEDDKRWKQQDEFDSVGLPRHGEEEEKDSSIAPAGKPDSSEDEEKNAKK